MLTRAEQVIRFFDRNHLKYPKVKRQKKQQKDCLAQELKKISTTNVWKEDYPLGLHMGIHAYRDPKSPIYVRLRFHKMDGKRIMVIHFAHVHRQIRDKQGVFKKVFEKLVQVTDPDIVDIKFKNCKWMDIWCEENGFLPFTQIGVSLRKIIKICK